MPGISPQSPHGFLTADHACSGFGVVSSSFVFDSPSDPVGLVPDSLWDPPRKRSIRILATKDTHDSESKDCGTSGRWKHLLWVEKHRQSKTSLAEIITAGIECRNFPAQAILSSQYYKTTDTSIKNRIPRNRFDHFFPPWRILKGPNSVLGPNGQSEPAALMVMITSA
jgi:hypothetical protein